MAQVRNTPTEIRPFAAADAGLVETLLHNLWGHDRQMLEMYRFMHREWPAGPHLRRTLVATVEGEMVGAGSLFHNAISPGRLMATINVAAGRQRQGIGSALFDALVALSDGRPWLARVAPQRDPAGWSFLTKRGFRVAIRTTIGTLDPQAASVRAWAASLPADVPGYRIVPADAPESPATPEEIALVHAAIARQYHTWNPIVDVRPEHAITIFCGEKVIPGSQLCVYAGHELVGGANLITHPLRPEAGEALLANFGVVGVERPGLHDVTAALLRRSLEFAAERGSSVKFEVDDPYEPHRTLLDAAPALEIRRDFAVMVND